MEIDDKIMDVRRSMFFVISLLTKVNRNGKRHHILIIIWILDQAKCVDKMIHWFTRKDGNSNLK